MRTPNILQRIDILKVTNIAIDADKKTQDFINHSSFISKGSFLKLLMVAEGSANIYPRLAPTIERDTAAVDAIVREAGKVTYLYDPTFNIENSTYKAPIVYNKKDLLNPWFVMQ